MSHFFCLSAVVKFVVVLCLSSLIVDCEYIGYRNTMKRLCVRSLGRTEKSKRLWTVACIHSTVMILIPSIDAVLWIAAPIYSHFQGFPAWLFDALCILAIVHLSVSLTCWNLLFAVLLRRYRLAPETPNVWSRLRARSVPR